MAAASPGSTSGARRQVFIRHRWPMIAVLALVLAASLGAPVLGAPPASALPLPLMFATYRDVAVDPVSGRVFIAADDSVFVFDREGVALSTIPNLSGAGGLDIDGGSLWVGETGSNELAEIDLATLTVTRELVPNWPVRGASVKRIGGAVWFYGAGQLVRYDLVTGARSTRGPAGPELVEVPGAPGVLITYDPADAEGRITKLDITTNPATVVKTLTTGVLVDEVVADPVRPVVHFVSRSLVVATEVSVTTMAPTAARRPVGDRPVGAATSAAGGGPLVAGSQFPSSLNFTGLGTPGRHSSIPLTTAVLARGVAASADGTRAYAIAEASTSFPRPIYLHVVDLRPALTSVAPMTMTAGVPTALAITGTNLAAASRVTIAGIDATFAVTSTGLTVDVPRTLAAGSRSLVVTTPAGTASSDLVVLAVAGATLSGTVRRDGVAVAGMGITMTGSFLAAPRSTVSAADGTYAFTGLTAGTDAALVTRDPNGTAPEQRTTGMVLSSGTTTTVDVHLSSPAPGSGAELARTRLPIGTAGALVVDTATDRAFVSAGDEVSVFDRDARSIGRIVGLRGAHGLALVGRDLWVNAAADHRIFRVDVTTLAVTGSWLVGPTNGEIVGAGGKLWIVSSPAAQPSMLASLDPATGTVRRTARPVRYVSRIDGAPELLYAATNANTGWDTRGWVLSVATAEPGEVATGLAPLTGVGSVGANRLWTTEGTYQLSDLQRSPRQHPAGSSSRTPGPVAVSSARGGLIALGSTVSRRDTAVATHRASFSPAASGFDAAGDRLFLASGATVVLVDLHPRLLTVLPKTIYPDTALVEVTGSGLLTTTVAHIDGVEVEASPVSEDRARIAVDGLAPGSHSLSVTTGWGTSNTLTFTVSSHPTPPTITSITPSTLPATGGVVVVKGAHLTGGSVLLGSFLMTTTAIDDSTLSFDVGPSFPRTVAVSVRTAAGRSQELPLTWAPAPPAPPTVSSVSPSSGANVGGTVVVIRGSAFGSATHVRFGGNQAPAFIVANDSMIYALTPPGPTGPIAITVTTVVGTSAPGTTSFAYDDGVRFSDVPRGAPFYADIDWAAGAAITTGYPDGTFRPLGWVDRQAMGAFLYRLAGAPLGADPSCTVPPFTDVPVSSPFCGEIAWLKAQGITTGNPDGTFRPTGVVDRRSMAAFIYRATGRPGGERPACAAPPFTDVSVGDPFCGEIAWMKANGIAGGYPDGGFHPTEPVNRQATAAFLHRLSVR